VWKNGIFEYKTADEVKISGEKMKVLKSSNIFDQQCKITDR
jgi:hypothetical protein